MADPIICGFDIETTGKLSEDHKIIEFYGGLWQGGTLLQDFYTRINPERTIAADAERVHGISLSMLIGAPLFKGVAPDILKIMGEAQIWAGHNIEEFDIPFLEMEMRVIGLTLPKRPIIDSMKNGSWATPDGKVPNLGELCFAAGVPYDPSAAHAADYDVKVNMAAINNAVSWGYLSLPIAA